VFDRAMTDLTSMDLTFRQFVSNAMLLAGCAINLWIAIWSVRRRGEFDLKLDRGTRKIRWSIVVAAWILASLPLSRFGPIRVAALFLGVAFLWWPNLAYYLMRLLRGGQTSGTSGRPQGFLPDDGGGGFTFLNLHDSRPPASSYRDPGSRR
jgi:hypothetical protein